MSKQFRVSWSMLRTYEACKQKAMLVRTGKRSKVQDIRLYFPGTVADRVMREWLGDPQPGAMPQLVRNVMEREEVKARETGDGIVKWRNSSDKAAVETMCIETVTKLEPVLEKLVLPYEYQPARRFWTPITIPGLKGEPVEIILNGEVDLLCRDTRQQWAIWDLKTTRDDSYWRKTVAQLTFYDLAHEAEFEVRPLVVGLIQPLCKEPYLIRKVSNDDRAQMAQRIMAYAHSVWREEFDPRADVKECDRCPVRRSCEKYKPLNPGQASEYMTARGMG